MENNGMDFRVDEPSQDIAINKKEKHNKRKNKIWYNNLDICNNIGNLFLLPYYIFPFIWKEWRHLMFNFAPCNSNFWMICNLMHVSFSK